jgi:hypothetical protein
MDANKLKDAFLQMQPPQEREALSKQKVLDSPAYTSFVRGKELGVDEMWTPSGDEGREIRKVVANLFNPEATRVVASAPTMAIYSFSQISRTAPRYRAEDDRFSVRFDVRLLVRESSFPMPRFIGEAAIVIEGPQDAKEEDQLRVREIKMYRAAKPPVEDKGGPGRDKR